MPSYTPGPSHTQTSGYNPARTNPVTGEARPHRGTDFTAPTEPPPGPNAPSDWPPNNQASGGMGSVL